MTNSKLNLEIHTKLQELQQALLDATPNMPTLLRDIHRTLKGQPEQVTLMSEDEIAIVVQGLQKQTNSNLAAATMKPSTSKRAALKATTMDDLGF